MWTHDQKFGYITLSGKVIWGPTPGTPDHAPIFGWSEQDRKASCEGIPDRVRDVVQAFPVDEDSK
ncbi:MAG: hypothetical protein ACXVZX_10435 [Terriglobales bacterium]